MAARDNDDIIDSAVVRIGPDLTGFVAKLEAGVAKAVKGVTAKVAVVADGTGLRASVKEAVTKQMALRSQPVYKVKVVADGTGLRDSVRLAVKEQMALGKQPVYKVKVVADKKGFGGGGGAGGGGGGGGGRRKGGGEDDDEDPGIRSYLVKLRLRSLAEARRRTRNPFEDVERAADQAREHELKQERSFQETLDRLHRRAEEAEQGRTRSRSEKNAQAHEQALKEDAERQLKTVRSLAEKTEKAEADARRAQADREASRVRGDAEKLERQRGQAQAAELARERSQYRTHQEYIDAQHRRALDLGNSRERKAADIREAENKRRRKDLFTSQKLIDTGGAGIRPMNLLYGVVVAMTPALFAMGTSAVQASTSIAALGSAGIGAALGLSAVGIAFQGIGDVLNLRKQVLSEETTRAANSAQGAVQAADDLAQSKRALADAQRNEADAYADVHKARREAVRDLQDLRQAVIDLDNQYRSDVISVAEARQDMQATDQNFFATALDRARARQDLRDAQTRLSDTTLQRKQKKEDLKQSLSKGIEGSDKVRDARERARDATDRRKDAQDALSKSSSKAAGGIDSTSSAAANLKKKIAELSPAAQDMYYWFKNNEDLFKSLQRQISQKTLPGFNAFLEAVTAAPKGGKSTLQLAAEYAGDLGAIIGKYVGKLGEWTKSPLFRSTMARIQERNARSFDKLGQSMVNLGDPILRILDKAGPGFESLADTLLTLSKRFADWIEKLDRSGKLAQWFKDSRVEAQKWYDIAKNILTILKNLFTAALPAGGSLVETFRDFTKRIADLSGSQEGQKWLLNFFDKVKNLPYAQIGEFFKNAATFFFTFRAFKFLKDLNPFFAAFAIFAASHPEGAAAAVSTIANAIAKAVGFLAANPKAAAGLLAIVAAAKFGKALGFDIKLPVVDRLRDALTSKFKFLDKFIGGGANAGTMTVHAGIVNVYGKAIGGGGVPGKPGGAAAAGGLALGTGITVAAIVAAVFADQGFQRAARGEGFGEPVQRFVDNPSLGTAASTLQLASPIGLGAYALGQPATKKFFGVTLPSWIGAGLRAQFPFLAELARNSPRGKAVLAGRQEANAFTRLTTDLSNTGGFDNPVAQASLKTYIANRKESIARYVDWVKSTQGPVAAAEAERIENQKSKTVLAQLATQYGYTEEAAAKYATAVYDGGQKTNVAAGWVKGYNDELGTLSERLDAVTGTKRIVLTMDGKEEVFKDLETALAAQQLLRQGKEATPQNLRRQKQIFEKNMAGGGSVGGYSPHDKADNIPAMLTANEYVQPVAAVRHYGTEFMEAIRTRQFPKYATGGRVEQWPFSVKMPSNAASVIRPPGLPGGDQEYRGRVPHGLGAVAGLGERMMNAVIAAHRQFPWAFVTSGYRAGAITATHNKSYHGFRRATDWPASMELFNYFVQQYGRVAKEIIYSPAGHRQIWNGRQHVYNEPTRGDHWDHVHLALAQGGQVRKYDTGGVLPPGYSMAFNGTGRNETVRTERQEQAITAGLTRLDRRDLALLANYMSAAIGSPAITMDGRRVAETTNRYNYLPTGV